MKLMRDTWLYQKIIYGHALIRYGFTIILCISLIVLWYTMVYRPLQVYTQQKTLTQTASLLELQQKFQQYKTKTEQQHTHFNDMVKSSSLHSMNDVAMLLFELTKQNQITLQHFKPCNAVNKDNYAQCLVNIVVEGSFDHLVSLLQKFSSYSMLYCKNIHIMRMNQPDQLQCSFMLAVVQPYQEKKVL